MTTCPHCLFCIRRPMGLKCVDPESFSYEKFVERSDTCKNFTSLQLAGGAK